MRYTEKERSFFEQPPEVLAPLLLGRVLCHRIAENEVLRFRITETEAYCGQENFCYGHNDSDQRHKCRVFYSTGVLCDYCTMLMISCSRADSPSNVLIRGAEQIESGRKPVNYANVTAIRNAFIAQKEIIDNNLLASSEVWLEGAESQPCAYCRHRRIHIDSDKKWRFCLQEDN